MFFVLVHGVVNIPMKCGIISVYFRTFAVYYSILNMKKSFIIALGLSLTTSIINAQAILPYQDAKFNSFTSDQLIHAASIDTNLKELIQWYCKVYYGE